MQQIYSMDKTNQLKKISLVFLLVVGLIGVSYLVAPIIPAGVDWQTAFRPAALEILSLRSPYNVPGFFNPPWATIALIPFALFPEQVGRVLLIIAGFISYAFVAHKLGGKIWAVIALLLSPPVMHNTLNGNIDWLAMLGVIMPPQIGLFFVTIKPQIGVAIVIFWLVESWRNGGWMETIRVFSPITLVTLVSFIFFGAWPLRAQVEIDLWWNASLWPMSLPVGLVLLIASLRKRDMFFSMGASPCFSPYILLHSWVVAIYAVIRSTPETIAAVIGLWILVAIRLFS
ncbi:MAG: hypothetical protein QY328_04190 [Anaerolineales bacterium]|nr:MAG: hypothetical protein QY328_04190 [Anaerolineales bacterium]